MAPRTINLPVALNEALTPAGATRPEYQELIPGLVETGLRESRDALNRALREADVTFGDENDLYPVDPVPRLIAADEWSRTSKGLAQRHEAINAFLEDVYGERRLFDHGVMPERVIAESRYFEPIAESPQVATTASIAGPDLIRDPSGELLVLEDNLRTPSGFGYAIACRAAFRSTDTLPDAPPLDPDPVFELLFRVLCAADPAGRSEPSIAILSEGEQSKAWFEHRESARLLGVPIVRSSDLEVRNGRLFRLTGSSPAEIHVLYNRSDSESLRREDGSLSSLGELLKDPVERGTLGCVNSFGAGVADDKAVHCYIDELISFYLGESALLHSVPGLDLGEPDQLAEAMDRLDELVIKPRWSFGGQGIVLGREVSAGELDDLRTRITRSPSDYVAQPTIEFSVHPTVEGERLEPRHVDLRAFLVSIEGRSQALPVALTRFAGESGDMIVNSTQGGGAKDTWLCRPNRPVRSGG